MHILVVLLYANFFILWFSHFDMIYRTADSFPINDTDVVLSFYVTCSLFDFLLMRFPGPLGALKLLRSIDDQPMLKTV